MCGRIAQYRHAHDYAHAMQLASPVLLFDPADRRPGFNLAPGAHPLAVLPDQTIRTIRWGYRPEWAAEQHLPQAIHARSDSAASSGYFRDLWQHGRVIVPVDGWYEWRTESGRSQPYYVYRRSREPVLVAGLSNVVNPLEHLPGDGLVLMTVANTGGVVDAHGQRPLLLDAQAALRWLDRSLDAAEVEALMRAPLPGASISSSAAIRDGMKTDRHGVTATAVDTDELAWHRVSPHVNRATHDEATLIDTID